MANQNIQDDLSRLLNSGIKITIDDYEIDPNGRIAKLSLDDRQIKDISWIQGMTELKELILSSNQISNVEPLRGLTKLKELFLSSNQISNVEPLRGLVNLTELYLDWNQIGNLEPLRGLTNLTGLYLSSNQISDAAPILGLIKLTQLYLSSNQINNVEPLRGLTNLTGLFLSSNQISNVNSLEDLTNLIALSLSSNQISDVEPLRGLTNLTELSLNSNKISNVKSLRGLTNLTYLSLDSNKVSDMEPLRGLTNLTYLSLSSNLISNIGPLRNLMNLTRVFLDSNQVNNVTPLRELTKIEFFSINENPGAETIPPETLAAGWGAIREWLMTLDTQEVIYEAKMLFLGNTNVGKSDLLYYLETGKVQTDGDSTHGLVYKMLDNLDSNWKIHCWDFGGQEFYHATHQLFFSPGALHLLLWSHKDEQRDNSKKEAVFELSYWLRCIEQLSKDTVTDNEIETILVENKIDLQGNTSTLLQQANIQEQINKFNNLRLHVSGVSITNRTRVEGLKELIKERIATLFNNHPARYKRYMDTIHASNKAVLSLEEIDPKADIVPAMTVLHNIGCLLYFPHIIPNKVFAKPGELINLLYEKILEKERKPNISIKALKETIRNNRLRLTFKEVEKLLKHFHLVFTIPGKEDTYYIPQYLPEAPPWVSLFERYQYKQVFTRITSDSYLMHNALLKIFSAYAKYVQTNTEANEPQFWKDGLVVEKNDKALLIKFNRAAQCIDLYSDRGHTNFELQLEIIHLIISLQSYGDDGLKKLRDSKQNMTHDDNVERKMDPWESKDFDIQISNDGQYFTSWKTVMDNFSKGIYQVAAKNETGAQKIYPILDFKTYLPNQGKGAVKKIFISYSKADLELVNTFRDHMSSMRLDGRVATWYCTELSAGSVWNTEIQEHFDQADIICFMISHNFMKTPYIHEHEIARAFARRNNPNNPVLLVPIYLDFCDWKTEQNDLTQFTALPYTLTPVVKFKNQNEAWYAVQQCLKHVIENNVQPEKEDYFQTALPSDGPLRRIYERVVKGDV